MCMLESSAQIFYNEIVHTCFKAEYVYVYIIVESQKKKKGSLLSQLEQSGR